MLLIARRESESVIINGSIEVKVIEIKGSRVKLGFEYPVGIPYTVKRFSRKFRKKTVRP